MRVLVACLLACACDRMVQVEVDPGPVPMILLADLPASPPAALELDGDVELQGVGSALDPYGESGIDALAGLSIELESMDFADDASGRDLDVASWPRVELWLAGERLVGAAELRELAAGRPVRHTFSDGMVKSVRDQLRHGDTVSAELRLALEAPAAVLAAAPMTIRCTIRARPIFTLDLLGAV